MKDRTPKAVLAVKVLKLCRERFYMGKKHMRWLLHCGYGNLSDVIKSLVEKKLLEQTAIMVRSQPRLHFYKTTQEGFAFLEQHKTVTQILNEIAECRLNRCD